MKGSTLYGSPMKNKLEKMSGLGPRAKKGEDDQSKQLAKSRYEMGEYKNDPTKPPTPPQGLNNKVMKDGAKTQTVMQGGKKVDFVPYSQRKKKPSAKKMATTEAAKKTTLNVKKGSAADKKSKKPSHGDFIPAYPGADISKAEYDKRRKAGSTKRD